MKWGRNWQIEGDGAALNEAKINKLPSGICSLCDTHRNVFAGTKRFYFRTVYYNILWIRVHLIAVAVGECVYARREITSFFKCTRILRLNARKTECHKINPEDNKNLWKKWEWKCECRERARAGYIWNGTKTNKTEMRMLAKCIWEQLSSPCRVYEKPRHGIMLENEDKQFKQPQR